MKLLQTFVGQLPLHDLKHGLPAHFRAVAELVRRVTLISAGVTSSLTGDACGRLSPVQSGLIAKVDEVEVIATFHGVSSVLLFGGQDSGVVFLVISVIVFIAFVCGRYVCV